MAVQQPAERSHQALHAANEQRTIEAASRNRKLAATALMRLGGDCPPEWEEVATAAAARPALFWDGPAHAVPGRPGEAAAKVAVRLRGEDS